MSRLRGFALGIVLLGASARALLGQPDEKILEAMVVARWFDQLPFAAIKSRWAEIDDQALAVQTLLGWLDDQQRRRDWHNVVTILGIVGAEAAVVPLIELVLNGEASIGDPLYDERGAAVYALAYLVHHSALQQQSVSGDAAVALQFLRSATAEGFWAARGARWGQADASEVDALERGLSERAVLALALTGPATTSGDILDLREPDIDERRSNLFATAVQVHQNVVAAGTLEQYYAPQPP